MFAAANYGPGNFSFPQNRDNPYGFHSSIYNNADIIAAYNKWYSDCVTSTGAGGFLRVQRPNDSGLNLNSTVSEGIGYGFVIAVYMNDENLFDNLWKYEQLHLDGNGLMNWYIDASGATDGTGAATDGDEDMAWGLLMAAKQWGGSGTLGTPYLTLAINQINAIYAHELNGGIPDGGDGFTPINPSYFAPGYYREFAAATGNNGWLSVAANCYTVLNDELSQGYGNATNGLDSAWCTSAGVSTDTNNSPWDYQYDACRTPFRTTEDYLWFGTASSQAYATKTSNFFSAIGAVSIVDGYQLNGTKDPQLPTLKVSQNPGFQSAAFVGPAGVGAMVSRTYQQYIDDTYSDLVGSKLLVGGTYYDESWTVMSLLMLSDNFLDYNLYSSPTPTPTLSAYAPLTIRVNNGGPQYADGVPQTWLADQEFTAGSWGYDATTTGSISTYTGQTIANTTNNQQTLYQTERWGNPIYHFTVPNGYYQVLFKFCENYWTKAGDRVFSVTAAGTPVITGLDVYAAAGGEHIAYDVPTTVVVTTGQLDIVFTSTTDTSQVNAIQVLRITTPPTPTATVAWTVTPTNTPTQPPPTPTATPTATFTATGTLPTATFTPSATPLYVNCAGPQYVSGSSGITWLADKAYVSGSWGYTAGTAYSSAGPISNTLDQTLYETERADTGVTYIFTLPNRVYAVTLKWAETNHTNTGQRVFNVVLNGTAVVSGLDIFAKSGGENVAYDQTYAVTVTSGTLELDETASVDKATIMAIAIVPIIPPTPTPTNSFTITPTLSPTSSPTPTSSKTPTASATWTFTATNSSTGTNTFTSTSTPSNTSTWTNTQTSTATATMTNTKTNTLTFTPTSTFTWSMTPTATFSPTKTPTGTLTPQPTNTPTGTSTWTWTATTSATNTKTGTPTETSTASNTATSTATATRTETATETPAMTSTSTYTPTSTYSFTVTSTGTLPPALSFTPTSTWTKTFTTTWTPTYTFSPALSFTPSFTFSRTFTTTATFTPTFSLTSTNTAVIPTATWTLTHTPTISMTPTFVLPTLTPTGSIIPVVYPNPTDGKNPVKIHFPYTFSGNVKVQIFTTAFRKVQDKTYFETPGLEISLELIDKKGIALSSGPYYVVINGIYGKSILKLLLLR